MSNFLRCCAVVTALLSVLFLCFPRTAQAQASNIVLSVTAGVGIEGQPLTITADLAYTRQVAQVLLAFRSGAASDFRQIEGTLTGNSASATIQPADISAPAVEYYFIVRIQGKDSLETYTYPETNPEAHPLRVEIQSSASADNTIIFLSPDPGASLTPDDLLISVSLIKADSTVKRSATKILIDEHDVTPFAVVSEDLVTLAPENINPPLPEGPHIIRIELYGNDGSIVHKSSLPFTQVSLATAQAAAAALQYSISGEVEARNENISSASTQYNRGGLNLSSQYGALQVNGRLYMTNEDKDNAQPQNRYYIEAKTSWLRAGFGDAYPVFPSLIMSGKRIRGVTANLSLGFFNLDFANGEIVRKVEGDTLLTFPKSQLQTYTAIDSASPYGPFSGDTSLWAKYRYGTFSRQLMAVRPSFGSGEHFQWGFTYLKAKDDNTSILYGIKPAEDLAVGTDMTIGLDNKNILLTAQAGASVYNNDISGGSITDAQIDSLYNTDSDSTDKRQKLKDIRDLIKPYMTVNQNLVPLSIDKIASIMSGEGALSLNYFNNYLKAGYIFHGSQYNSFGQNYIRRDVKGINLYDRIRILQNQLFLSLAVERLEDNLDQSKLATTTFNTWNAVVSYFPRFNFPNLTVGYGENTNTNGLLVYDPFNGPDSIKGQAAIEDKNTRYFVQAAYDFIAMYRQNVALSIGNASRDDKTYQLANTQNTTISTTLTTTWDIPLQTAVGVSLNMNKVPLPQYRAAALFNDNDYTSLLLSARYRMMEERLRLSGSLAPTFGDFQRTMWDGMAEYQLMRDVWAVTELSMINSPGVSSDVIWSIVLRYNM